MVKSNRSSTSHNNAFYRRHFHTVIIGLVVSIIIMLCCVIVVLYQIQNRPIPSFHAVASDQKQMHLVPSVDPNLLSTTLIKWANQAVVAAYTYDFSNYEDQLALARPYFTENGWLLYQNSTQNLINTIRKNQLIVNGVVSGPSVISNSGDLPDLGMTWRIQIPFLVTYQGAENVRNEFFIVTLTIVRVPTTQNPAGIGIDQFVMR